MDAKDPYWIGRVLDSGNGSPQTRRVEQRETLNGTSFQAGDIAIAVQWFHRDDADSERLTFVMDAPHSDAARVDVFNSTELRVTQLELKEVVAPTFTPAAPRRSRRAGAVAARTVVAARTAADETKYSLTPVQERVIMKSLSGA